MDILEEFYKLKAHLQPILSEKNNKILIDIERVLIAAIKPKKKKIKSKRPTKTELYNRLFYKGINDCS